MTEGATMRTLTQLGTKKLQEYMYLTVKEQYLPVVGQSIMQIDNLWIDANRITI
jgi:hypothetical protein